MRRALRSGRRGPPLNAPKPSAAGSASDNMLRAQFPTQKKNIALAVHNRVPEVFGMALFLIDAAF